MELYGPNARKKPHVKAGVSSNTMNAEGKNGKTTEGGISL